MTESVEKVTGYPGRLTTNDSQCLQHCRIVVWNVPANFVGRD